MSQHGSVYVITNLVNGKQYVGQTIRAVTERWKRHQRSTQPLGHAIRKYGALNFNVEIVIVMLSSSQADLDAAEVAIIRRLSTLAPTGYNLSEGGRGGRMHQITRCRISATLSGRVQTAEERLKRSIAQKGRRRRPQTADERAKKSSALKGRVFSAAHRSKISAARKGSVFTEEHRAKLSAARRGRAYTLEQRAEMSAARKGRPGRSPTAKTKAKISATLKGRTIAPEVRANMRIGQQRRRACNGPREELLT